MAKSRKELDKDLMFQKIMPALNDNPFSAANTLPNIPRQKTPESSSALNSRLFARADACIETGNVAAINAMEDSVLQNIDSVIQRFKLCKCDRCRRDVTAYALNNLPPKYVEASADGIAKAVNEVPQNLVMDALVKAAIYVRSHPNH